MNVFFLRNRLCIPLKGYNRSIIYDLVRNDYHFISNQAFDIVNTNKTIHKNEFNKIDDASKKVLFNEEILFEIKKPEDAANFPPVSMTFEAPFNIIDLIIPQELPIKKIKFLRELYIQNISILVKGGDIEEVVSYVSQIDYIESESVYLYFIQQNDYDYEEIMKLKAIPNLVKIYLFNSSIDIPENHNSGVFEISMIHMTFEEFTSYVHPEKLIVNNELFFESQNYHTYFHKKVFLTRQGEILNGMYSNKSFGNVNDTNLIKILSSQSYSRLGSIKKDGTSICNLCEFRGMCTDPRTPINGSIKWFHTSECSYNPFISKWKYENGYKTLKESGVSINNCTGEIEINFDLLNAINKTLWNY